MKILCLAMEISDRQWLSNQMESSSADDEIVVVAPTFEGRFLASSMGITCKSYEDIAWGLDKPAIQNLARHKARFWHEIPELESNLFLRVIKEFNGYPLLAMHQSRILLGINEVIQAHRFIRSIVDIEKPDAVLFGNRQNPFYGEPLEFLNDNRGVEREVVKSLLSSLTSSFRTFSDFAGNVPLNPPVRTSPVGTDQFDWPETMTGPKVLIFAWTYYYIEYFEQVLDQLLQNKSRICIVVIGGELTIEQQAAWREKGICSFLKTGWALNNEEYIWNSWRERCEKVAESIYDSQDLKDYFSDELGSYYPGLVSDILAKEIISTATTVIELLRTEAVIKAFAPDMVLSHFSCHPLEACDVLPARALGIPTLSFDHGICGFSDSQRSTFATEYYGAAGSICQDAMAASMKAMRENVPVVGNTRYDLLASKAIPTVEVAKKHFGFDPERPLCVFCDSSGWSHGNYWRHSTFQTLESILSIKTRYPNLQIIYRVHHGSDYKGFLAYFSSLNNPDIHFQISLDRALLDILPAVDVVVSHNSSAVAETLLSGVPVIYLSALGETEPSYFCCDAIRIADNLEKLPGLVGEVLDAKLSRTAVKQLAQPYFDIALAGNDGKASERLAVLILALAMIPGSERKPGFQDWLDRVEASSCFDTKEYRKCIPKENITGSNPPFVSVIIPSYNRDKMIGITLESFINQNYPKDHYEIIVADNNSTDNTKAVVMEWQSKSPVPVSYIFEERQGVHYARNTAAKHAKGGILYFTDDDMIAEPELLIELVKVFDLDPMVGAATGRVLPRWESSPPDWIIKLCYNGLLSIFDELGEALSVYGHDFGVYSCHQAIRREAFFQAGGYNPESTITDYIGDGETGLNIKLRKLGYRFGYNGKSIIHHMIPKGRMTQDYLNKRLANQGYADCYTEYREHRYSSKQLNDRIVWYMENIMKRNEHMIQKRAAHNDEWRLDKAYTYYYLSRIEYDSRLMHDESFREMVLVDNWID